MFFDKDDIKTAENIEPLQVNTNGTLTDSKDAEVVSVVLANFVKNVVDINFEPPYQRIECWTPDMQGNLIKSILCNKPIPPVYLSTNKESISKSNCVDGKQRTSAIMRFYTGKLKIPIIYRNNTPEYMSYKEIEEAIARKYDMLKPLKDRFDQYVLSVVKYHNLNLPGESMLMGDINTYVPMTNEEAVLGANYLFKNVLRLVLPKIALLFKHIEKISMEVPDTSSMWIARIWFTCFGPDMTDTFATRDLGLANPRKIRKLKPLNSWIEKMNKNVIEFHEQNDIFYDLAWSDVENMKFYSSIRLFLDVCESLLDVLEVKNTVKKHLNKNDSLDIICFLIKKQKDGIITKSIISNNKKEFLGFITKFVEAKKKAGAEMTSQSVTPARIQKRFDLLEKIYSEFEFSFNKTAIKNQRVSAHDDTLARLKSENTCGISGDALSERNGQTDHVNAASLGDETEYVLIGNTANREKSNLSKEKLELLVDYMSLNGGK